MFTREVGLSHELLKAALTRIDRMYRDGDIDETQRDTALGSYPTVSWAKQKNFTVCILRCALGKCFCGVTKRWPKDKPNNKFAEMASFICAVTDLALHAPKQTEEVTHAA